MTFYIYDENLKRLKNVGEAFIYIYMGGKFHILLNKNSNKRDYTAIHNGEKVSIESKVENGHVYCEPFNISKKIIPYLNFVKKCQDRGFDPKEVNDSVNKIIIEKYGDYMISEVLNRLPDYFRFHSKGHTHRVESKSEFLEKYIFEIVTKKDEGGREIKLDRLSVNYSPR